MADSMYNMDFWNNWDHDKREEHYNQTFETSLLDKEIAFDAADVCRVGKDLFIRRGQTANHLALEWLRREFPDLRVHMTHHKDDYTRHNDSLLVPIRPPTPGSHGIALMY
jgi:glycine amidinotransferase